MRRLFLIIAIASILGFASFSFAVEFSIGASPPLIDIGNVFPGESKIIQFNLITISDEPLLVTMIPENSSMEILQVKFPDKANNYSEEGTSNWIEFIENPVEIATNGTKIAGRTWKNVKLLVHVPENAEPGYHVIHILPIPYFYGGSVTPTGTSMMALTRVTLLLRVEGETKRGGIILDTVASGRSQNSFEILSTFKNTGSVTIYCSPKISLYDNYGHLTGDYYTQKKFVSPNSTTDFAYTIHGNPSEQTLIAVSSVDYFTDKAEQNTTITLPPLQAKAIETELEKMDQWWMIILIIAIFIVIFFIYMKKRSGI